MDMNKTVQSQTEHIQHLEKVVQNTLDTLELCAFFEKQQAPLTSYREAEEVVDGALSTLQKVFPILFYGIYLVEEHSLDLYLYKSYPSEQSSYLQRNLEQFIESGTIAWALRENRTVLTFSHDHQYEVLLHSLETHQRTHGIVACFLQKNTTPVISLNSILFTILMRSTAYAYENFKLYKEVDERNEQLNQTVQDLDTKIKEKDHIEERLRNSEVIYRNIFENTGNETLIVDQNGWIILANSRFLSFSGYEREEIERNKNILDFFPQEYNFGSFSDLISYFGNNELRDREKEFILLDSRYLERFSLLHIHPLGIDSHYIISLSDISRIKQAEQELNFRAYHDSLTRLPNRDLLKERLAQAIKKSHIQANYNYALLFIDIDRLKIINDTRGHSAGDSILSQIAQRLQESVREVDTVARFGGDEFVVLLEGINSVSDCESVVQRIYYNLQRPVRTEDLEIVITLSIGIYLGGEELVSAEEVIRYSDLAMYQAKQMGRNKYVFYNEQRGKQEEEKLHIENELSNAIYEENIHLNYQPIVNLQDGEIFGLEALVRWEHKEWGCLSPGTFIPIAEDTGLIVPLGKKIFSLAFREFTRWLKDYPRYMQNLHLCLNLSVIQLLSSDIVSDIQEIAEETGMPFDKLNLEITETLFIREAKYANYIINQFKEKGMHIAIDDFGTGYSSLRYLDQFSIDLVKIDMDLVQNIDVQESSFYIVDSMLALNNKLDIDVVAEGIETPQQLATLQNLGCKFGQGFLFSRPLTEKDIRSCLPQGISSCLHFHPCEGPHSASNPFSS